MDITGEYRINATQEAVWAALNDPAVLKSSIPGCETLDKISDTAFSATVTIKVGPVKAKFTGKVTLSAIEPPNGYVISGNGQGGAAGFANGEAKVSLKTVDDHTILTYEVKANVGGKLAQVGSRLIDGTAKKLASEFFDNFTKQLMPVEQGKQPTVGEFDAPPPEKNIPEENSSDNASFPASPKQNVLRNYADPTKGKGVSTWLWASCVVIIILLILFAYSP